MTTQVDISEISRPIKELSGPTILLEELDRIPEFHDVKERLAQTHRPLFERWNDIYVAGSVLLSPDVSVEDLYAPIFQTLVSDYHSARRFGAYLGGLLQIIKPLGSPASLIDLLLETERRERMPGYSDFVSAAAQLVIDAGLADSQKWNGIMKHLILDSTSLITSTDPAVAIMSPVAAKRNLREMEKVGRKVTSDLKSPDPRPAITVWILVNANGHTEEETAKIVGYGLRWTQEQHRRGNELLGFKRGPGRRAVQKPPVDIWREMEFSFSEI